MSEKVEGTVILDGLIQGKVPSLPGAEQRLREWGEFARSAHIPFNLEIAGGTFGFLADQTPIPASDLGHDPAETIKAALIELLKVFPPGERPSVFSTLRGVEYLKNEEVQTLYIVAPDGSVLARGRTISAATTAPSAPPSVRDRAMRIGIGAALLLLLLMVSSLFIDYRATFSGLRSQLRPLDAPHFPVDASAFDPYFTIESKAVSRDGQGVLLTLRRTSTFLDPFALPTSRPATTQPATTQPASTQPDTTQPVTAPPSLAAAAIATGYVRCEFFDEKDRFVGFVLVRIKPLREAETMQLEIPFERGRRPSRITITY